MYANIVLYQTQYQLYIFVGIQIEISTVFSWP